MIKWLMAGEAPHVFGDCVINQGAFHVFRPEELRHILSSTFSVWRGNEF